MTAANGNIGHPRGRIPHVNFVNIMVDNFPLTLAGQPGYIAQSCEVRFRTCGNVKEPEKLAERPPDVIYSSGGSLPIFSPFLLSPQGQ